MHVVEKLSRYVEKDFNLWRRIFSCFWYCWDTIKSSDTIILNCYTGTWLFCFVVLSSKHSRDVACNVVHVLLSAMLTSARLDSPARKGRVSREEVFSRDAEARASGSGGHVTRSRCPQHTHFCDSRISKKSFLFFSLLRNYNRKKLQERQFNFVYKEYLSSQTEFYSFIKRNFWKTK